MAAGMVGMAMAATEGAQTKAWSSDFNVSDGKIEEATGNRLMVRSKEGQAARADGRVVWQGTLVPVVLKFKGRSEFAAATRM